ncbi:protein expanded-like isoform X2 [Hylaeus anthracinus]|uniref:protein expanded-like isoform X2 n=1 Tax=Hylaeus anthracinus TaxID=313031 RepID=UPI0023B88B9E|nr:protein expanded-like isoform X2 [Hylaeus anthracinus]
MRGSGVTAARSCLQPLVSASRYLAVQALPGDPLYFVVEAKSRVKEVYAQTCMLLGQQGMRDCELFGLAILSDGEYLFVDPENKLSKYAPKNWRSSHTYGLDSSGRPAFVLYFRVRYYVDTPLLLSDETTRHHYYLQLRDNVVRHGGGVESLHPHHPLHEPTIVTHLLTLAGLALQADLGDHSEERHRPHAGSVGYCKPTDYLPPHMCLESNVLAVLAAQHRDNRGLSREEAELQYIREAVLLEAPLNAHLYRLRRSKNEPGPGRILLAICARGVRVYAEEETPRVFAWNNIGKLCFDRKKFEIRAVDQPDKLTLYSGCDDKSKLLLGLCRDTHQFSMAIAPRVNEAKRREEEERKVLRDCYMYPARCKLSLTARGARGDQRISVISSTSSNTTSGIVSDRVHSEDEPDTAPASTECLPRLTENTSHTGVQCTVVNGTNADVEDRSMPPSPVSTVDVDGADSTPTTAALRLASNTATAAEGSQCSSSCSTVVVVNAPAGGPPRMRRTSATSSLELGYSHTAQNSAVSSETASFPGAIYDRCKKTGKYAGTDIASETSGVYTLRSSEMQDERIGDLYSPTGDANESSTASDVCALSSVQSTTDEASVTSGFYTIHSGLRSETSDVYTEDVSTEEQEPIYSICKGDDDVANVVSTMTAVALDQQLDDPRSRSNSILSAGSFRGDGSDPSSVGPLLSADELSDLIVGRYPPRKTISNSMDSDCDYVTMPPPPPPPRTDSDRQLPPPPPYPSSMDYATINSSRSKIPDIEREPPPPPPYNATRGEFVPLPPRRTDPPPPPPPYTSPRERIQIPPPTPPRNDAVTPREPPPPPPYPEVSEVTRQEAISTLYPTNSEEIVSRVTSTKIQTGLANSKANIGLTSSKTIASQINDVALIAPKPPPRIQPPTYPGDKMKPTPVHAPVAALVVGPNNYLDVHASRGGPVLLPYLTPPPPPPPPPPPMVHPRQPPPPPPSLATVYTSQVARSQIEQYKQQLYSDVDYVMFPLKDPAVSKQEYIDAKQGSLLAAMAAYPPPPYPSFNNKSLVMYRSTPYLPGSSYSSPSKYASNQNLSSSDTSSTNYLPHSNLSSHYAASTSSLYSGATCSSAGSQSLRREPPAPAHPHTLHAFSRTRSDENILKCFDSPSSIKLQSLPQLKHRRLPPPPPPPPYEIQNLEKNQPLPSASSSSSSPKKTPKTSVTEEHEEGKEDGMLDIRTLREKSRNLDLPLISALCNDRYLLKQTKAFVMPKHPTEPTSSTSTKNGTRSSNGGPSSRNKYPVSGLSTTQITKPPRKSSTSTHKHPAEIKGNSYKITNSTVVSPAKKDTTRASHS